MAVAAAQALSPAVVEKPRSVVETGSANANASANASASASASANASANEEARWRPVLDLPCQLTVDLPLPGFRLADFLKLEVGSVVATRWRLAQDVPLRINGTLIAWGEFEGAGQRLAVRLTELA